MKTLRSQLLTKEKLENNKFIRYRHDPVGFIDNALNEFTWSKQREICEALKVHRRVAVKACHAPGKSFIAARIAAWWVSTAEELGESFLVTSAPTFKQVAAILWREIRRAHRHGQLPGRLNKTEWFIDEELVGFGRKPADADMTGFQGIHAPRVLVLFDEACGIPKTLFDGGDTLIANEASRMLAIGNPDDPTSEFARVCQPGSGWHVITISAFDTPNFTGEHCPEKIREMLISKLWVEEKRKSWGEGSILWQAKILGEFPEEDNDSLLKVSQIRAAQARDLPPAPEADNELGVDIARKGSDSSVIYHRHGSQFKRVKKLQKRDLMYLVGEIINVARDLKVKRVKIDDAGLGGGVTDRLNELKNSPIQAERALVPFDVVPVNVGEGAASAEAEERFANLRAELNWALRNRFWDGDIQIDDNDDLLAQATGIRYGMTSKGKLLMESKEDMKKRGLPSPDDWDAMVLANAVIVRDGDGWFDYWQKKVAQEQKG